MSRYAPAFVLIASACIPIPIGPNDPVPVLPPPGFLSVQCQRVPQGYGPAGTTPITVEIAASGLEIPWGIAWLPDGDMLVTERTGGLLRIRPGGGVTRLAEIPVSPSGEGGLLGIALHPDFAANHWVYLYYTTSSNGSIINQVERWILSPDGAGIAADRVIVAGIPARQFHNGGRIRFGPDGRLYVGTGDAGSPDLAQDVNSLAGKILRVTDEGGIPDDNPFPGSATWIYGVRNTQGLDWRDDGLLVMTDHGPSGGPAEGFRSGHDEFNVAYRGANLGWPDIFACETAAGMVSPSMTWAEAMPPGGAAVYTGTEIPEWRGDVFIGVLGGENVGHLHRLRLSGDGNVVISETYLRGDQGFGRLRDIQMGPDGGLYVTSSNCDGRGTCGDGDVILRIGRR
ncbi:MAG: PQQ-dependent sugar dehydrogenase [Phycisphaerae bacterium]